MLTAGLACKTRKLSPARTGLAALGAVGTIEPRQKRLRRADGYRRYALRQARFRQLPVSEQPAPRVFAKLEYLLGIFIRGSAERRLVVLHPVAPMLLVDGHGQQSDTIAIVLEKNRADGCIAAADKTVRLLKCERRGSAGHGRTTEDDETNGICWPAA